LITYQCRSAEGKEHQQVGRLALVADFCPEFETWDASSNLTALFCRFEQRATAKYDHDPVQIVKYAVDFLS
jgi:hypothetical protein